MNLTYQVFLRSKTVNSDWSFFVLPNDFKKNQRQKMRLLKIINDIYRDDTILSVTHMSDAFYCFPLNPYLICMRLRCSDLSDISGRPIWTFVGIVADISQSVDLKIMLPKLVLNNYLFDKIEANYIDYQGIVPFPPKTSYEYTLNVTTCEQQEMILNNEKQNREERMEEYHSLNSKILWFPFNNTGKEKLISELKRNTKKYDSPLEFFGFGPGFQAFGENQVVLDQFQPIIVRLKSGFLTPIIQDKSVPTMLEYCHVREEKSKRFFKEVSTYVAEKTDDEKRIIRLEENKNLSELISTLEKDGWLLHKKYNQQEVKITFKREKHIRKHPHKKTQN